MHEHRLRSDPGYVREKLFEKEKGVCQQCGINTEAEKLRLKIAAQRTATETGEDYKALWRNLAKEAGWPPVDRTWWEADHIVAVAEGGGLCGLEGYQTLCIKCHKEDTANLRHRLKGTGNKFVDRTKSKLNI